MIPDKILVVVILFAFPLNSCYFIFYFIFYYICLIFSIPAQLPATVSSLAAKQQNFSISLFARLFKHFEFAEDSPIQHLYTQYRMASDIMAWPNQYFYGGKLKCGSQDRRCPIINYKVIFQPITAQLCMTS